MGSTEQWAVCPVQRSEARVGFSQGGGRWQWLGKHTDDMAHFGSTRRLNHIFKWRSTEGHSRQRGQQGPCPGGLAEHSPFQAWE